MNDDIYEQVADLLGQATGTKAIPREVMIRHLKTKSPDELRAALAEAVEFANKMTAEGKMIVYDPADLARVREIQRRMK